MADGDPVRGPAAGRGITENSTHDYLADRIRDLESEKAALTERVAYYRDRLAAANERLRATGRMGRIWLAVRATAARPWRAPKLPLDIVRILRSPPPPEPVVREEPASPEALAAERAQARRHEREVVISDRMTSSHGAPLLPVGSLRVAIVADDWLIRGLDPECELVPVHPGDWLERLEPNPPDLLLVQSAWQGDGGSWQYRLAWDAHPDAIDLADLRALTGWCRRHGIPVAFWDTSLAEDRKRFAPAAELADAVFAADPRSAGAHAESPTRTAAIVDVLPFGIQPRDAHPDGRALRATGPVFVGGFHRGRPIDRREALERLLDAGLARGVIIHDVERGTAPGPFGFPVRFEPAIANGRLPEAGVPERIRAHPAVLVDGSGPNPDGRVSRRLLEAIACGATVVTTPGPASTALLGDAILIGSGIEELVAAIDVALADPEEDRSHCAAGVATVMAEHTLADRLAAIARSVGLAVTVPGGEISLLVVDPGVADPGPTVGAIAGQARLPTEIVVGTTDWDSSGRPLQAALANALPDVPVRLIEQSDRQRTGERIRRLAGAASGDWTAIADIDRLADGFLIRDLAARIPFAAAAVIGRPPVGVGVDQPASVVEPYAALARIELVRERIWPDDLSAARLEMPRWATDAVPIFAASASPVGPRPGAAAVVAASSSAVAASDPITAGDIR